MHIIIRWGISSASYDAKGVLIGAQLAPGKKEMKSLQLLICMKYQSNNFMC